MKTVRRLGGWTVGLVSAGFLAVSPSSRLAAQDSFPAKPPAPAPLAPVRFPAFQEARLPNGLNLIVIENHEQPTVSVTLSFRAGSTTDPAGKEGLAELAAELLTKGTQSRTAEQIAASIEGVGGTLTAGASQDFLTLSASSLTDHLALAFQLLGDVTLHTTIPATELELARTRYLSNLSLNMSTPAFLADRFFDQEIYGAHPYGRSPTEASYKAVTRDDVVKFVADRLRPSGALMVVAGDVSMAQVRQLLTTHLAGWQGTPPPIAAAGATPAKAGTDILLVNRPGSVQSNIIIGNTSFLPGDTNYYASRVVTQVLGGGSDARLFMILREQKSWTYGAYASLNRPRDMGYWQATAEVRTEVTDSALAEMLKQIDRIRTEAIPDSELNATKGFLVGVFPLTIETPGQVANQVATVRLLGLPRDYLQTYRDRLAGVTAARARAAAAQLYRRSALTIVVVGDAAKLHEKLMAIAPVRMVSVEGKALTHDDLTPRAGPLTLDRAQIVSRTDSFRVVINGNPLGTQVATLRATGDSVVYTEQLAIPAAAVTQNTRVVFHPADLTPVSVEQVGTVQGQPNEIHLAYGNGRVKGNAKLPQQSGTPREVAIDTTVGPATYDDNSLTTIIPALALAPGKTFPINVLTSGDGSTRVFTAQVGDSLDVTVPAGTFKAYRVEVTGGQAPFVFYVSTTTPRRLVKIEVVGAPFVFELVK